METRRKTNIEFQVRTNSCRNKRTRTNTLSKFPGLRNVVKDRRCVAHKLRLHSSIDKHFKHSKEQMLLWRTRPIPSSSSLLQRLILLRRSLEWLHHACLFYTVHRSTVLCTCAFTVNTLYNHVPHHKACTDGSVVSSTFSSNCASSAAQDIRIRNRTVMHMYYGVHFTVRTYNMRVRSFSFPIFKRIFEPSFVRFTPNGNVAVMSHH